MVDFFRAGGFGMWFVLLFGGIDLAAAVIFAARPEKRRLGAIVAVGVATLLSTGNAIVTDLATVCSKVPTNPEWANSPRIHLVIMQGIAESLTPAVLGLSLLTLVALTVAVGYRRLSAAAATTPATA